MIKATTGVALLLVLLIITLQKRSKKWGNKKSAVEK